MTFVLFVLFLFFVLFLLFVTFVLFLFLCCLCCLCCLGFLMIFKFVPLVLFFKCTGSNTTGDDVIVMRLVAFSMTTQ